MMNRVRIGTLALTLGVLAGPALAQLGNGGKPGRPPGPPPPGGGGGGGGVG